MSGTKKPCNPGIGMPAALYLDEFGALVDEGLGVGFGTYHVGSSLHGKVWRDVDVRSILSDDEYAAMGLGDPDHPHQNPRWVALTLAFAALGKHLTGLPIDYQIQQQTHCNKKFPGPRSALGINRYFRSTLVGNPAPRTKELGERMTAIQPGDLVLETSTIYMEDREGTRLGKLVRIAVEPISTQEEWTAAGAEPDEPIPEEQVWYLELEDGREYRWTNASFIAVPTEIISLSRFNFQSDSTQLTKGTD